MHRSSRAVAWALTVAAVGLAGCGGDPAPVPQVTTVTAAAPATPAAATLTIEQAGKVYLAAVAPGNRIVAALNAESTRTEPRMDKIRGYGRQLQAADRHLLDVLTHTAWPPEAQTAVDALARDVAAEITWAGRVAKAKTRADVPAPLADTGSAQLVRAKLRLGVVPQG